MNHNFDNGSERNETPRSRRNPRMESEARQKKRRRRMIAMIVAECFALAAIFGYGFVARIAAKIQRPDDFEISEIKTNDIAVDAEEKMKGYWTIAIFGVDSRDNSITKGTNSDVNMICNINRDTGEIKLVSVYRDSYLNTSEGGSYNKINNAYATGGPKQAVEALNRNLDLQIQDYMTFNWKAVANAIDILGGVDIELSKAEFYYINSFITETVKATGIGSHQLTHAGMNHLDGVQAVAYGRLRLMDTDYARTERQRKVIAQAFEKAKKADFQTLYVLIGTVFPQVSTSIWVDDLVSNAKNISKFRLGETAGFPQARGEANMGKKGAVVVPATLESNVIRLHQFLFGDDNYTPSETVKRISAKISADTGIYKEGQFIDKVGTSGGVIQPPKMTPASTEKDDEYDSENEDGGAKPTSATETDEYGNPIETEDSVNRRPNPTDSLEDFGGRPIIVDRPTATEQTTEGTRPGGSTNATTQEAGPGGAVKPTAGTSARPDVITEETTRNPSIVDRPGESTQTTEATRPSETAGPGGANVIRPGGNVLVDPGNTAAPTAPAGPGANAGHNAPGGGTTPTARPPETIIHQEPGGSVSSSPMQNGIIASPGQ